MQILLAFALFIQEKTPEEILLLLQEQLGKAKTVRVTTSCQGEIKVLRDPGTPYSAKCLLLLGQDNKVFREVKLLDRGHEDTLKFISDGSKTYDRNGTSEPIQGSCSLSLKKALTSALIRLGVIYPTLLDAAKRGIEDFSKMYPLSDYEIAPGEDEFKSVKYSVFVPALGRKVRIVLWYDPKSLRMVKRTIAISNEAHEEFIKESYEFLGLDAEIPDDTFRIPSEK